MDKRMSSLVLFAILAFMVALSPSFAQGSAQAAPGQQGATGPAAAPGQAAGKNADARAVIKALALTPDELAKIEAILTKDEAVLARKRADIEVFQAQIARLMLEANPSLDQVGALVKQGQASEYDIRMIQFARQIEVKKLLGDKRWAALYRFARAATEAGKAGRLKEAFDARRLDKEELKVWTRLLEYARRFF